MIVNQSFYQHKLIPDMYFSLWTLCRQNNITWTKLAHRHCSDCTAPAGPLLFSVPDGSLVFLRLHLRWLTASVCMCVYTLSCFPPPPLRSAAESCLHVYLCRVNDSVISRSPSSRRYSGLTYHCLLTRAKPKQVSSTRLNPPRTVSRIHSHASTEALSGTHTATHTHTRLGNHIFGNHPSLECTLGYNAIWARSHTQTRYPSLSLSQAKIPPHSCVQRQETIHSCSDREINKRWEKNKYNRKWTTCSDCWNVQHLAPYLPPRLWGNTWADLQFRNGGGVGGWVEEDERKKKKKKEMGDREIQVEELR